jgi:hypothetical protein
LEGVVARREKLIIGVEEFFTSIIDNRVSWNEILIKAKVLKSRIRTFLVASEYFDVPFHIALYDVLSARTSIGSLSGMEIYGSPPEYMNHYFEYHKLLELIKSLNSDTDMLVEIVYERSPLLNIYIKEGIKDMGFAIENSFSEVFIISVLASEGERLGDLH